MTDLQLDRPIEPEKLAAYIQSWVKRNDREFRTICCDVMDDVALPYETFIYNLAILAGMEPYDDDMEDDE